MSGKILVSQSEGDYLLKFEGEVRLTLCGSLNQYMERIFTSKEVKDVIVDLLDADVIDSTTLGLLAKLALHTKEHFAIKPTIFCTDDGLIQILESMGLDDIYRIVDQKPEQLRKLELLPEIQEPVDQLQRQILEAHKLLVLLKPELRLEFVDLIQSLEENGG